MINNEDIFRWQRNQTTQQDAFKAGTVHGYLQDSSEIMKIAAEKNAAMFRLMDEQRGRQAPYSGGASIEWSILFKGLAKALKLIVIVISVPLLVFVLFVGILAGIGGATKPDISAVNRSELAAASPDPSFYMSKSPKLLKLSRVSSSQIRGTYFPDGYGNELTEEQEIAAQALWLHFLKNQQAFLRLPSHEQRFYRILFDHYLVSVGKKSGSPQPYIDRGRLKLVPLDPVYSPVIANERRAREAWFEGALIFPDNVELAALSEEATWENKIHRLAVRGWNKLKAFIPVRS